MLAPVKVTDSLSVAQIATILGFPASAFVEAINRNRQSFNKPFYSIPQLADRWNCSRANVYNILREGEFRVLNVGNGTKKSKWNVPAAIVQHIESSRTTSLPETEVAA